MRTQSRYPKQQEHTERKSSICHDVTTMVFNLVAVNKEFRYYWWLLPSLEEILRRRTKLANQWPRSTRLDGVEILDPLDFPGRDLPPLNRKCNEENIHLTILAEYDNIWPRHDYLELYFRVYQWISNLVPSKR